MGKVIHLPVSSPIPPKSETYEHAGQKYTCVYDPNEKTWVWILDFTRSYRYFGSSPTLEAAATAARKRIHLLNRRTVQQEEGSA